MQQCISRDCLSSGRSAPVSCSRPSIRLYCTPIATLHPQGSANAALLNRRHTLLLQTQVDHALQALPQPSTSTSARITHLLHLHAHETARLQRALRAAAALVTPDPPASDWRLLVSVESSRYFLTEGSSLPLHAQAQAADGSGVPPAPREFAAPLGLGAHVPRFLRRDEADGAVALVPHGHAAVEAAIAAVWRAKAERDAALGATCALHSFLYEYLAGRHPGEAAAAAEEGYSLYHAAGRLRGEGGGSAAADVFVRVLTGQLPEGAFWEQQRLLEALRGAVGAMEKALGGGQQAGGRRGSSNEDKRSGAASARSAAPSDAMERESAAEAAGSGEGGGEAGEHAEAQRACVSSEDLSAALRFLLPFKLPEQAARLSQLLLSAAPKYDLAALARAVDARMVFAMGSMQGKGACAGVTSAAADAVSGGGMAGGGGGWGRGEGAVGAEGAQSVLGGTAAAATGIGGEAQAAADEVVEELLQQQLEEISQHAENTLQRARQVLLQAAGQPAAAGPKALDAAGATQNASSSNGGDACGGGIGRSGSACAAVQGVEDEGEEMWDKVLQVLQEHDGASSLDSNDASSGAGEGSCGGGAAGIRTATSSAPTGLAAAAAAAGAGSLLAAAAAARIRQGAGAVSEQQREKGAVGYSSPLPAWLRVAVCRHAQLVAEQQAGGPGSRSGGRQDGGAAASADRLLARVRASILLLPLSCRVDVSGVLQWASITLKASSQGQRVQGASSLAAAAPLLSPPEK